MRAEGPGALPVVAAPMAGGPSTPELVAAVADADHLWAGVHFRRAAADPAADVVRALL